MAALTAADLTITICEEDRELLKELVKLLEKLSEQGDFKRLAKEVIKLHHDESGN